MPLKDIRDHRGLCTWHDDTTGVRCNTPGVMGSAERAVCAAHLDTHMKQTQDPEAYREWRKAHAELYQ